MVSTLEIENNVWNHSCVVEREPIHATADETSVISFTRRCRNDVANVVPFRILTIC
jgi:hypothetical protein